MLSISIVTHNSEAVVQKALDSILDNLPENAAGQLFVVDNLSTDNTRQILSRYESLHDRIHIIENERNLGYGAGHNLAVQEAKSSFHAICNPDIVLHEEALSTLVSFMKQYPEAGIVSPRFQFSDGRLQPLNRRYPSVLDLLLRRFAPKKIDFLFKKRLDRYAMLDIGYDDVCDVLFASGAFMFCRTDALKKICGFDPSFFLYFEDVDLSRRMQQEGYRTLYCPWVTVTHGYERGSHKNWHLTFVFIKSAIKYFNKWGYKFW